MSEDKSKKAENLEELDIEVSKIRAADDGEGPGILDSKRAGASAGVCGRRHSCGDLVKYS